jgi:gamma-glutamyltranspeptidase|tara:strand:+ start:3020 stop:3406 length:387 start_codon:yes stop_codon:yes gene_type:complete
MARAGRDTPELAPSTVSTMRRLMTVPPAANAELKSSTKPLWQEKSLASAMVKNLLRHVRLANTSFATAPLQTRLRHAIKLAKLGLPPHQGMGALHPQAACQARVIGQVDKNRDLATLVVVATLLFQRR